ncbi:hypothetical protein CDCA_CDCA01G0131 [Cyanidium caldarium]|uniref:Vta1/callose synthase N-terminal domain-containing protein n=1 Tax=Cyanidium caldarium TaxID=2771 RepID=A0AAV9IPV8_CYACA|nr:hypothetical protein CDCA_CDCA01G0131 [Cyanidium caldarium]
MSPTSLPPSLKPVAPFFARGKEVERVAPIASYYTRLYGVERGLEIRQQLEGRAEERAARDFLQREMAALEQLKQRLVADSALAPTFRNASAAYVELFARDIFQRADAEDRQSEAGADMRTAEAFYAASVFFEALRQFHTAPQSVSDAGEADAVEAEARAWQDIEDKIRYCRYKCASIRKALREGQRPERGSFGEEASHEADEAYRQVQETAMHFGGMGVGSRGAPAEASPPASSSSVEPNSRQAAFAPASSGNGRVEWEVARDRTSASNGARGTFRQDADHAAEMPAESPPNRQAPSTATPPVIESPARSSPASSVIPVGQRKNATRHVRAALSALDFHDAPTAMNELRAALDILTEVSPPG